MNSAFCAGLFGCLLSLHASAAQGKAAGRPSAAERAVQQLELQRRAGRDNLARENYAAAAWAFRQALILDPSDEESRRMLHDVLFEQSYRRGLQAATSSDWPRARDAFLEALDVRPDNPDAREKLREARYRIAFQSGLEYRGRGLVAEAHDAFEQCLTWMPSDPTALRQLAALGAEAAQVSQAQTAVSLLRGGHWLRLDRELRQLRSSDGDSKVMQALYQFSRGQVELARTTLSSLPDARDAGLARDYIESRRRRWYAIRWAVPAAGAYVLLLSVGILTGLRRVQFPEAK